MENESNESQKQTSQLEQKNDQVLNQTMLDSDRDHFKQLMGSFSNRESKNESKLNKRFTISQEDLSTNSQSYFKQDSINFEQNFEKLKFKDENDYIQSQDFFIFWDWSQYAEFFFYHLIFQLIGPLTCLLFYKKEILMRNLGFYPNSDFFFLQFFIFLMQLFTFISTIQKLNPLSQQEQVLLFCLFFFRVWCISCKYALMNREKIKLYKQTILSKKFKQDQFILEWAKQSIDCQILEVYSSMRRKEIDPNLFKMSFMSPLNPQSEIQIKQIQQQTKEYFLDIDSPFFNHDSNQSEFYQGIPLFIYLNNKYYQKYKNIKNFYFVAAFLVLQILARIIMNLETIPLLSAYQIVVMVNVFNCYYSLLSWVFAIMMTMIFDFKRIVYLQIQCSFLIRARKSEEYRCYKKHLPTITINSKHCVKAWSILRNIVQDYGKGFMKRAQSNASVMLLISIWPFIFVLYNFFISKNKDAVTIQDVPMLVNAGIVLISMIICLYYTAVINEFTLSHIHILEEDKQVLNSIVSFKEFYICDQISIENTLFKSIVAQIKSQGHCSSFILQLNETSEIIDDVKKDLLNTLELNPFKILSLTVSFKLIKTVVFIILTVTAYSVIYYYNNQKPQQKY